MVRNKERIFFLPNHTIKWLKSVIKTTGIKKEETLIIGSLLYAAYLPNNLKVTVIDKNPLALISQLYILWLKQHGYSAERIKEILFLNKFGNRLKIHRRFRFITMREYLKSLKFFLEFSKCIGNLLKKKCDEKNFRRIFRLRKWKKGFKVHLIPKGLNSNDFLRIKPVRRLEEVKFINTAFEEFKIFRKFSFIISTNVIENFDNPFTFFKLAQSFLAKRGNLELTTYNESFGRYLRYLKILISNKEQKVFTIGNTYFFKGKSEKRGKEYSYELKMNRDTFIFSKQEVDEILKLISERKFLPTWLRNVKEGMKFHTRCQLFGPKGKYIW